MLWKVDLEKAYEKLRWSFIEETLQKFGMQCGLINLIMSCLQETSVVVIWNGSICDSFQPTRGVRQGCPLSPYIFVMCMEQLAGMIDEKVQDRSWTSIRVSRRGIGLSHLFYVDGLILMGEAFVVQTRVIVQCLQVFSEASGEVINPEKSKLFFLKNTSWGLRRQIRTECGIPMTAIWGNIQGALCTWT